MGSEFVRTDASSAWSLSVGSLGHILWEPRLAKLLHRTRFGEIMEHPSGMIMIMILAKSLNAAELLLPSRSSLVRFESPGVEIGILERWMTRSRLRPRWRLAWGAGPLHPGPAWLTCPPA